MDAKPNWRESYQATYQAHVEQLRQERRQGCKRQVDFTPDRHGGLRYVYELTDRQISDIAWREAEIDLTRAINEWNASEGNRKQRRSEAL